MTDDDEDGRFQTNIRIVSNFLEEYFSGFILLGFDASDESPVVATRWSSHKDRMALRALLEELPHNEEILRSIGLTVGGDEDG